LRDIARELRRSVSTIADELIRNRVKGHYLVEKAQHKAYVRRKYARFQGKKIAQHRDLRDFVEEKLYDDQSPEAIAGRLKLVKKLLYASKDSIYRYIKSPYGRRIEYHRSKVRQRRRRKKPRTKPWKDRTFIDKRPASIKARLYVGHAEGDFIVSGRSGKGVLLTVEDRKLRATFVEQILNPTTKEVTKACRRIKRRYPEWKTMTTDNDLLFQHHKALEETLNIKIYFCFPGHMWEKPQIENANGYIRRYIPKGSDISRYSKHFIKRVEAKMNRRYMKVLGYHTPQELLNTYRKKKKRHALAPRDKKDECSD